MYCAEFADGFQIDYASHTPHPPTIITTRQTKMQHCQKPYVSLIGTPPPQTLHPLVLPHREQHLVQVRAQKEQVQREHASEENGETRTELTEGGQLRRLVLRLQLLHGVEGGGDDEEGDGGFNATVQTRARRVQCGKEGGEGGARLARDGEGGLQDRVNDDEEDAEGRGHGRGLQHRAVTTEKENNQKLP